MSIMEKKRYKKPEVSNTKIDYSINLVLMSEGEDVGEPDVAPLPNDPVETVGLINPFKWFR
jgi:hypothetical protein